MELYTTDNSFGSTNFIGLLNSGQLRSLSSSEKQSYSVHMNGEVSTFGKTLKIHSLSLQFKVLNLSCGREHTALLTEELEVYTWGNGLSGALGTGLTDSVQSPQKISLSQDFNLINITCGGWHTVLLSRYSAGKNFLLVCGRNSEGQLGTGRFNRELSPVRVQIPEEILDIKAGNNCTMVLSESKSIYMCGDNRFGQLGLGHKRNIFYFERLFIEGVQDIACGNHSAAIAANKVYVWGTSSFGEYLRPTFISGILSAEKVFVGDSIGAVIDNEKNVWVWGGKAIVGGAVKTEVRAEYLSLSCGMNFFAVSAPRSLLTPRRQERSQTGCLKMPVTTPKNVTQSPSIKVKKAFVYDVQSSSLGGSVETPKYNPGYRGFKDQSPGKQREESKELKGKVKDFQQENEKLIESSKELSEKLYRTSEQNVELTQELQNLQKALEDKDSTIQQILHKARSLEEDQQILLLESGKLKETLKKLSADRERLLKSFQSESELKFYYEKCISDLERTRESETRDFIREIEKLKHENDSIQSIIFSMREENSHLFSLKSELEQDFLASQKKLQSSEDTISSLEQKIFLLQEQLNDLTSANHALYTNLEKTINSSEKNQLVIAQATNLHDVSDDQKPSYNEEYDKTSDFITNRKGLSQQHQERLMKIAAEKMRVEDLDQELLSLSSNSPVHRSSPIRVHKKSFEDVQNTIKNLKKNRSSLYKDVRGFNKVFRK